MDNKEKIKETLSTEEGRKKLVEEINDRWASMYSNETPISKELMEKVLNQTKNHLENKD